MALWACWAIAALAALEAAGPAYVTYATNDYRPILIRGAWMGVVALVALQCSAFAAKGWKARLPGLVGALLVMSVMAEILGRLAAIAKRG